MSHLRRSLVLLGLGLCGCNSAAPPAPDTAAADKPTAKAPTAKAAKATAAAADPTANPFLATPAAGVIRPTAEADAVRQVSAELWDALAEQDATVVWLLDGTSSATDLRDRVLAGMDATYQTLARQLPARPAGQPPANLQSAVAWFGESVAWPLYPPTADAKLVRQALSKLPAIDDSGQELPGDALASALDKFSAQRSDERRFVMFVLVSDEAGDDQPALESLIPQLTDKAIPVYAIGVPSAFGNSEGLSSIVQVENWEPVRQGPESREPELVRLETSLNLIDVGLLDSGFGPFALERLARQTGGSYFAIRDDNSSPNAYGPQVIVRRFDPHVMQKYAPDYVSEADYRQLAEGNAARRALIAASAHPPLSLQANLARKFSPEDQAALKRSLDDAQRPVARIQTDLRVLYDILAPGERDRANLEGPRWQAAYDLALGRVLAARARYEGYNGMLAYLKGSNTLQELGATEWVLVGADSIEGDSALDKLAERSRETLERVIWEHPGTPWALLAAEELKVPVGWKWTEAVGAPKGKGGDFFGSPAKAN